MARVIVPAAEEIIDRYFPVLDHGFVALVDYMGNDQRIVDGARTSYGLGTKRVSDDRALGRYLYRARHTTPIEMCELLFHCKMPIVAARQWIRQRMASVNEYSGRYSLMPMLFYTPKREHVTTQSTSNKQGRSDNQLQLDEYEEFVGDLEKSRLLAQENYEKYAGTYGMARELARLEMPLSLYTEWYWKIDSHNLTHFLGSRCDAHAQYEIRVYADIIAGMLNRVAPNLVEAWLDYHPNMGAALLSRQEIALLKQMVYLSSDKKCLAWNTRDEVDEHAMTEAGLSKRERDAFLKLFDQEHTRPLPNLELDLSVTKDAAYFKEQARLHTPKIDQPQP